MMRTFNYFFARNAGQQHSVQAPAALKTLRRHEIQQGTKVRIKVVSERKEEGYSVCAVGVGAATYCEDNGRQYSSVVLIPHAAVKLGKVQERER